MKYLKDFFSVCGESEAYANGYDHIDWGSKPKAEPEQAAFDWFEPTHQPDGWVTPGANQLQGGGTAQERMYREALERIRHVCEDWEEVYHVCDAVLK